MAFIPRAPRRNRATLIALATVAAALAAAPMAQAETYFWLGGDYDGWSSLNWFYTNFYQHIAPSSTLDISFGAIPDKNGIVTNNIADNFVLRSLNFANQAWSMDGKSLNFVDGGSINVAATSTATTIGNSIFASGSLNVDVAAASKLTLSGGENVTGTLTKTGTGDLTFSKLSGYAGAINVNAGSLTFAPGAVYTIGGDITINAGSTFTPSGVKLTVSYFDPAYGKLKGTGNLVLNGGSLNILDSQGGDYPVSISGSGNVVVNMRGRNSVILTLPGNNTYTGGTAVYGGELSIAHPTGNYSVDAQSFLDLFDEQNRPIVMNGSLSGAGGLGKYEDSTATLNATSTYTGGTLLRGGTVVANAVNALGLGPISLQGGTILDVRADVQATSVSAGNFGVGSIILRDAGILTLNNAADSTVAVPISGTGGLTKKGNGTLNLLIDNTYSGTTRIDGGTLAVSSPAALGTGPVIVNGGATLDLRANATLYSFTNNGSALLTGNTVLTLRPGSDLNMSGSLSGTGSLIKQGVGTLTLAKASYTGATTIDTGTLKVTGNGFRSSSVVAKAGTTFQFDGMASGLVTTNVSGAGDFLKTGTGRLILDGSIANTGSTIIAQGAIYAISNASMGGMNLLSGARFTNDSQGTIEFARGVVSQGDFATTSGSRTVFDGLVSGAGGFSGFGEVRFDGGYHPGNSPASVTLQGDMTLGSANDLTMELGGTTLGTGYDHLNVLGATTLGGTLTVAYYNGFSATLGQSFDLFDFNSSNGAFSSITLPTLAKGLAWSTSGLYTNGIISVQAQAVPEPASLAALGLGAVAFLRRRRKV